MSETSGKVRTGCGKSVGIRILGVFLLFVPGCFQGCDVPADRGRDSFLDRPVAASSDYEEITGRQLVDEARRRISSTPDQAQDAIVDISLKWLIAQRVLLAAPPSHAEAWQLTRMEKWRRTRQCLDEKLTDLVAQYPDVEEEARRRFEANPRNFIIPARIRLQIIFIPRGQPNGEQLARRLLGQVRGKPDEFGKPARRYSRLEITDADGFADFAPDSRSEAGIIEAVAKQQAPEQPFFLSLERGWYHRDPGPYYYADLNYAKTHNSEIHRPSRGDETQQRIGSEKRGTLFVPEVEDGVGMK